MVKSKFKSKELLPGFNYFKLTVLSRGPGKGAGHAAMIRCSCECGAEKDISASSLTTGLIKSCGCSQMSAQVGTSRSFDAPWKLAPGVASMNSKYGQYKKSALKRGYEFEITRQQFEEIVTQVCYYCGTEPSPVYIGHKKGSGKPVYNGPAIMTGIDRLNNNIGYVTGNCVPCCKECNFSKLNRTADQFLDHAKRIVEHQQKR